MRRSTKSHGVEPLDDEAYFTYRPLSNLPTPPPSSRTSSACQSPRMTLEDDEELMPRYRGAAVHLVNLIPSSSSLATASVPLVHAILSRANLPIETVALAVCILDSLDSRFARRWRLSCPLRSFSAPALSTLSSTTTTSTASKRHTLPPAPILARPQLHIDSVSPELIVLAALVIAVKFTEDPQEPAHYYCDAWGRARWMPTQLNGTERCIMENLGYRIMPLCDDECLTDAMVDMQLAAQHYPEWESAAADETGDDEDEAGGHYVPSHSRSKTLSTGRATLGLGLSLTPVDTPAAGSQSAAPQLPVSDDYFQHVRA